MHALHFTCMADVVAHVSWHNVPSHLITSFAGHGGIAAIVSVLVLNWLLLEMQESILILTCAWKSYLYWLLRCNVDYSKEASSY